jgi:hypothetical protein
LRDELTFKLQKADGPAGQHPTDYLADSVDNLLLDQINRAPSTSISRPLPFTAIVFLIIHPSSYFDVSVRIYSDLEVFEQYDTYTNRFCPAKNDLILPFYTNPPLRFPQPSQGSVTP